VSSTARTRPPVATPSRRPSGVVRATFYGPSVKHGTDACKDCTSIRTTVRAIGFGATPIARSNPINSWGFKRLLRASYFNAAAARRVDAPAKPVTTLTGSAFTGSRSNARPAAPINAATQTASHYVRRHFPSVIGVAAPITTSRSYAGHRFADTGHERDSYSVVTPARRAPGSWPDRRGRFFTDARLSRA